MRAASAPESSRARRERGTVNRNVAPSPGVDRSVSAPPWRVTILCTIGSPTPLVAPSSRGRSTWNILKMRAWCSGAMPGPVSRTRNSHSVGRSSQLISSSPAGARAQPRAPYVPLTDVEWRAIEPLVAASRRPGGRPVDLRAAVDGARWVLERGAKWRELPSEYGAPTTTWRWYKRWKESGLWDQLIARLRDRID